MAPQDVVSIKLTSLSSLDASRSVQRRYNRKSVVRICGKKGMVLNGDVRESTYIYYESKETNTIGRFGSNDLHI